MTYAETTEYLFNSTPLFQNVGKAAYKEGLANTFALDDRFGHPHREFLTIHVAGTNGKGSVSHTLASILQTAGYKVGLFTSPHLMDFRERIRINGEMISEDYVVRFVEENKEYFDSIQPSFFELTTAMAFKYFAECRVDVAVVEVGLGGRLDCTNIITPLLSVITNISFDHVQFLGDTLAKIASEKAGIIKQDVPVVIGESLPETRDVFASKAAEVGTDIIFAEECPEIRDYTFCPSGGIDYSTKSFGCLHGELGGLCQTKNTNTILTAVKCLQEKTALRISTQDIKGGIANVCTNTGLMGRWQRISESPLAFCDTGHNSGGFQYIVQQLRAYRENRNGCHLHIVFGMVNDKDISTVLSMLPKDATYYFTQASVKRALPVKDLYALASKFGLEGSCYDDVEQAYKAACESCSNNDMIYVGGSTFIVSDVLNALKC